MLFTIKINKDILYRSTMNTSHFNTHFNTPLYGVHNGLIAGQFDRVDELNGRIASRYFPERELQPNFDPRPVPTKYALFPVIERRAPVSEPIRETPKHSVSGNFNPANRRGPVQTYLANIDTETVLRNQTTALQSGAEQSYYVPSSNSDLYHTSAVGRVETQTHPGLFERPTYNTTPYTLDQHRVGTDQFHNNTRVQLRGIADKPRE